jgi:hypothetical protein
LESDPLGLTAGLSTYGYVDQSPIVWADPSGQSKGGKKNLNTEGFTKNSDPKEVEKAMNEAKAAGQDKRYLALRALFKVIKRGGSMGLACEMFEQYQECQRNPCACDPNGVACMLEGT